MKIKSYIEELEAYVPGFQPDLNDPEVIKLNANENAFLPSPKVLEALKNLEPNKLRLYPEARSQELREAIAKIYNVNSSEVLCGNGSDEIIALIIKTFLAEGEKLATPYPTYTVYQSAASMEGVRCVFVKTDKEFKIDIPGLLNEKPEAIFIVNPNAPTGVLLSKDEIKMLLDKYDGLLVIDEAYMDFCTEDATMINYINQYDNLIVLRTMSKSYSLCGARVGYCFACEKLIAYLDRCRDSYNLNYISQTMACAAVKDEIYHNNIVKKVIENREYLSKELINMGFEIIPSQTNFLLCIPPKDRIALEIMEGLTKSKIYIRYFNSEMLDDKLRISVGKKDEIDILIKAIKNLI
jgi:histidinol-phosphate aminotransferase